MLVLALGCIAFLHQRLFLAIFMFFTAFESTRDFAPTLGATFSGVHVYPADLFTLIGIVAGLARIGQWQLGRITRTAMIVLVVLQCLGVLAWISTYGLQTGVNCWRAETEMVALLLYATTRPRAWSLDDLKVIIVAPAVIVALASVIGILMHGFGSNASTIVVNGVVLGTRPASAAGSLLMMVGLWVVVLSAGRWGVRQALLVLLLGGMVLLNQDRSVWVAAIVGLVVWWFVPRKRSRGASSGLGGLSRTFVLFIVAAALAIVGASVAALGQSASNGDTLQWRIARWSDSMSIPRSWVEWLVGSVLGPTPASSPTLFATSAHSLYVNAIEMTGFIGLVAILCVVIAVGRTHLVPSSGPLGYVICLTFLSFGVTYQLPPWTWMLVGILLASSRTEFIARERPLFVGIGSLFSNHR